MTDRLAQLPDPDSFLFLMTCFETGVDVGLPKVPERFQKKKTEHHTHPVRQKVNIKFGLFRLILHQSRAKPMRIPAKKKVFKTLYPH